MIDISKFINKAVITEQVEHFVPEHMFNDFALDERLKENIAKRGYVSPTPIQDRDHPGRGFTHKAGDLVRISSPKLGTLLNRVTTSKAAPPWEFGIRDLMNNLARRGLLAERVAERAVL